MPDRTLNNTGRPAKSLARQTGELGVSGAAAAAVATLAGEKDPERLAAWTLLGSTFGPLLSALVGNWFDLRR